MTEKLKIEVGCLLSPNLSKDRLQTTPGDETGLPEMLPVDHGGSEGFPSRVRTWRGGLVRATGLLPNPERPRHPPRKHTR